MIPLDGIMTINYNQFVRERIAIAPRSATEVSLTGNIPSALGAARFMDGGPRNWFVRAHTFCEKPPRVKNKAPVS